MCDLFPSIDSSTSFDHIKLVLDRPMAFMKRVCSFIEDIPNCRFKHLEYFKDDDEKALFSSKWLEVLESCNNHIASKLGHIIQFHEKNEKNKKNNTFNSSNRNQINGINKIVYALIHWIVSLKKSVAIIEDYSKKNYYWKIGVKSMHFLLEQEKYISKLGIVMNRVVKLNAFHMMPHTKECSQQKQLGFLNILVDAVNVMYHSSRSPNIVGFEDVRLKPFLLHFLQSPNSSSESILWHMMKGSDKIKSNILSACMASHLRLNFKNLLNTSCGYFFIQDDCWGLEVLLSEVARKSMEMREPSNFYDLIVEMIRYYFPFSFSSKMI